jgi:hypothetical protein
MKREGQIRHKLKQVIFRHRKKFVEKGLSRRPENCAHNGVVRLPVHTGNRATIRVCQYRDEDTDEWNNRVCDSTMAGDEQARHCPYFECGNTPDVLKATFSKKLGLGGEEVKSGALAQEYPDIIALMWVLESEQKNKKKPDEPKSNILAFFGSEESEPEVVPEEPLLEDEDG